VSKRQDSPKKGKQPNEKVKKGEKVVNQESKFDQVIEDIKKEKQSEK